MPADVGSGRYRKLTSASLRRVDTWMDAAPSTDQRLVGEAVMCILEDTWPDRYHAYLDLTHSLTFHIEVRPGLLMSARYANEYPDTVQIVDIGAHT